MGCFPKDASGSAHSSIHNDACWFSPWKVHRQNDLGLVQLDKPFTGVVPFEWIDTPLKATMQIGVVGYPGDKQKKETEEKGAEMYEMWAPVSFNRELAKNKMLDYPISSAAGKFFPSFLEEKSNVLIISFIPGQSGSPVLAKAKDGIRAIGIHTYGGTENNSATAIGTDKTFGNRLEDYIKLIDNQKGGKPTPSPTPTPRPGPVVRPVNPEDPDAESAFWDVLKTVGRAALPIAKGVLSVAPIATLGPVGAVLAPLAGIALDAAGKLVTESSIDEDTTDSVASQIESSGAVHRAILAEAALTAVLAIPEDTLKDSSIIDDMKAHFVQNHVAVKTVAPAIRNAVLEPGFRVALDVSREQSAEIERLKKGGKAKLPTKKLPLPGAEAYLSGQESDFDGADFVKAMVEDDTTVVPGAEGWFGSIVDTISSGVQAAAPVVGGLVLDLVKSSLTESDLDDAPGSTGTTKAFDTLAQRSLMGEAALQALMKQDVNFLKEEHLSDRQTGKPESIFGFMKSVIQTVGPRVVSALPHVIKAVAPLVEGVVKKNAESGFPVATPSQPGLPKKPESSLAPPLKTVVRKKSKSLLDSLTDEGTVGKHDTQESEMLGEEDPEPDMGWVSE